MIHKCSRRLFSVITLVALLLASCAPVAPPPPAAPPAQPAPPAPTAAPARPAAPPVPAPTAAPARPAPPVAPATGRPTGTLTMGFGALADMALLPRLASAGDKPQWDALYDYLTRVDRETRLQPSLATAWEASPDAKTWTFTLRRGVSWHKGEGQATAEDVKFSIEQLVLETSKGVHTPLLRRTIDRVEAPSPDRVVIRTKRPAPDLALVFSNYHASPIIPRRYIERVGEKEAEARPIGSGSWQFVSRAPGASITLEAAESHWRKTPEFKTLRLVVTPETSTRVAMLRTGQADIADVEPQNRQELERAGIRVQALEPAQFLGIMFLGLWWAKKWPGFDPNNPLLKKEVRQALNLAIDRKEMGEKVLFGLYPPAPLPILLSTSPGWNPAWKPYLYDPEQAKKLLAQSGYTLANPLRLRMWLYVPPGTAYVPSLGEATGLYWEKVGVKVEFERADWAGVVRPAITTRNRAGVVTVHRGIITPLWAQNLDLYLWTGGLIGLAEHPVLEEALNALFETIDPRRQAELVRKIGDYVYDEHLYVPLFNTGNVVGLRPVVGEWTRDVPMYLWTTLTNFEYVQRRQ